MTRYRLIVYALILLLMLRYTKVLNIENLQRLAQRVRRRLLPATARKDEVQG
jgi:hypothetical protein